MAETRPCGRHLSKGGAPLQATRLRDRHAGENPADYLPRTKHRHPATDRGRGRRETLRSVGRPPFRDGSPGRLDGACGRGRYGHVVRPHGARRPLQHKRPQPAPIRFDNRPRRHRFYYGGTMRRVLSIRQTPASAEACGLSSSTGMTPMQRKRHVLHKPGIQRTHCRPTSAPAGGVASEGLQYLFLVGLNLLGQVSDRPETTVERG